MKREKTIEGALESLLYISGDEGLEAEQAARALGIETDSARRHLISLKDAWAKREGGLQITQAENTFFFVTVPEAAEAIEHFSEQQNRQTLSQAALETLAIIAYNQPVLRADIDQVRGVKSDRALQTLLSKGLVKEFERTQKPGRPMSFVTSTRFLEYFGLETLEELPPLEDEEQPEQADLFFRELDQDEE